MSRQKASVQVAALKKQQEELLKKLKEAKAKELQAINKDIKRKTEIAGALALKEFEKNPEGAFATTLLGLISNCVTKDAERALFNLRPLSRPVAQPKTEKPKVEEPKAPAAPIAKPIPAAPPKRSAPSMETQKPELRLPEIDLASLLGRRE
jgi:hypothetical protein